MIAVLTIVYVILILYLFLLALRIVLGWFAPQALGKAWTFLTAATDPYLAFFRRISFLRGGLFDFSPIAAFLVLVVVLNLVTTLMYYGRVTLGFFLISVVSAAWSGVSYLLLFFLVVGIIRVIPLLFRAAAGSNFWRIVVRVADTIVQPVVAWIARLFRLGSRLGATQQLLLTLGILLVAWLIGQRLLLPGLVSLLQMIPV